MFSSSSSSASQIKFSYHNQYRETHKPNMVFTPNPLSLSLTEPAFESWLRDSGYLQVLDQRTTDLHRVSGSKPSASSDSKRSIETTTSLSLLVLVRGVLSAVWTLLSLFTFNPFAKLTSGDFSGEAPSWTLEFWGSLGSYSFPTEPSQARLRVHENVKRFARNYASLFVVFFACSLYQFPRALIGLITCIALWEGFKFICDRWALDRYPIVRETMVRIAQCVTAIILLISNVQLAVFGALAISYAVMILHASFRTLTPGKQTALRAIRHRTFKR